MEGAQRDNGAGAAHQVGAGAGLGSCFAVGWVACVSTNTAGALAGESENQSWLAQSSTQPPSPPCPSSAQPALHPAGRGGAVPAEGHHQPQPILPGPAGRGAAHTGEQPGRMCFGGQSRIQACMQACSGGLGAGRSGMGSRDRKVSGEHAHAPIRAPSPPSGPRMPPCLSPLCPTTGADGQAEGHVQRTAVRHHAARRPAPAGAHHR